MRRTPMPPRTSRLSRGPMKQSRKPLAKRGRAKAKREKKYKSFLSSAAWKRIRKAALERAGYQCERTLSDWDGTPILRCAETEKLAVHHLTYARFGGNELPTDLRVLCSICHNELHAREGKRIA
jgi:5-methylcytosine-specific restriction endonuclease McrA